MTYAKDLGVGHWLHATQLERTIVQCINHTVVHAHRTE